MLNYPLVQHASRRSVYFNFDPCILLASACIPFLILYIGTVMRQILGFELK